MDPLDFMNSDDPSPNEMRQKFLALMQAQHLTTNSLAAHLVRLGDNRKWTSITRSIQRMLDGYTTVSGEILVILRLLARRFIQKQQFNPDFTWSRRSDDGSYSAESNGYKIALLPKSKGRWLVQLTQNSTGYVPPWRSWNDTLEQAKEQARDILFEELEAEQDRNYEEQIAAMTPGKLY